MTNIEDISMDVTAMEVTPVNKNASMEVRKLLQFFKEIQGKRLLTGQHTQTREQEELEKIYELTGKYPAICGFELLSYSPHINYEGATPECLTEIERNRGTLEQAHQWADKNGIVTFTWHWYSPIGGVDKSFYTKNTDFDANKAVIVGTPEYEALISDMDVMADLLKPFAEKRVPILWRPFHEADGNWFWWGAKGPDAVKKLWRIMYQRYTEVHQLNNLIWVWNAPVKEYYPGDDVVDIISRDLYPQPHNHTALTKEYEELCLITDSKRMAALGEIGVIPDIDEVARLNTPWLWYMTWSNGFVLTEQYNSYEEVKKMYQSEYSLTLEDVAAL